MKKLKNIKARLLSLSLAFAMVLSLAMGMAPMEVQAAEEPTLDELKNTIASTFEATLTVGNEYIQCSELPTVKNENYKWVYCYIPTPSTDPNYEAAYDGYVSYLKDVLGVMMKNTDMIHSEALDCLIVDMPEDLRIPVSIKSYGILCILQVYDYKWTDSSGMERYYFNQAAVFDVSREGTVSNGLSGGGENPPTEPEQNNKIKDLASIVNHDEATNTFTVTLDPNKRYVISNMPFEFYNNNGNGMSAAEFNENMGDVDDKVATIKTGNSLESFEGVTDIYGLDQALAIVKVYDAINLNTLVTGQSQVTVSLPNGGVFMVHEIKDGEGTELRDSSDGLSGTYYITAGIHGKFVPAVETSGGGEGSEFNVIDKIDININPEFLADLAEGTYNKGKFSPFELGNGSKEGNANIYQLVGGDEVALYCGDSRVGNGDPVDLENETYHVVDIIKISDQRSRHRFANEMTALSDDDKFTFDLLMASNNDNPIQYNFFATVTYVIAPGGEQGGGSNPPAPAPTPTPDNGSNGGSSSGSDSSSTPSTSTPSTSTPSTAPITVPVSNGGNDNVLKINASLSGETAKVNELTAEEIDKVAKNETKDSIEINLSETGKTVKEAALPVSSLNEIARIMDDPSNKLDNVTIKLSTATVEISEHALKAVLSKTTGNDLRLVVDDIHKDTLNNTQKESVKNQNVHMCIDAYFISNGVRIGDFQGGTATIRLPFNVPDGLNGNGFSVWYVGDDGTIEKHDTQYVNGELVFTVSHFSDYVVVYDGAVKDDVPKTGEAADYTTLVWTSILAIGVLGLVLNRQKRRQ